jgi:hypothetical protein
LLKNRFFKSAMSEQLGDKAHAPKPELPRLYRTWAEGGAGLLVTGNVMIDSRYLGEAGNVVLENERHLEAFRAWARAGADQGAQLWMQLNHPGKQIPSFFFLTTSVGHDSLPFCLAVLHSVLAITTPKCSDALNRCTRNSFLWLTADVARLRIITMETAFSEGKTKLCSHCPA